MGKSHIGAAMALTQRGRALSVQFASLSHALVEKESDAGCRRVLDGYVVAEILGYSGALGALASTSPFARALVGPHVASIAKPAAAAPVG